MWKCIRDWNTSAKYAQAAQAMLNILLKHMTIDSICEMEGSRELIEGIIAYTEKHFGRAKKLGVTANLVGYTIDMMDRI